SPALRRTRGSSHGADCPGGEAPPCAGPGLEWTWQSRAMATSPAEAPGSSPTGGAPVYTERLTPSPLVWVLAPTVGLTMRLMVSALSQVVGIVLAVAGTAAVAVVLWATSPRVEVTIKDGHRHLHAGRASIGTHFLGDPQVLDAE